MKNIILLISFFIFSFINGQETWRPIGPDDFNAASYGTTNNSSDYNSNNLLVVKNSNVYVMNMQVGEKYNSWLVLNKFSNGYWEHINTPFWFTQTTNRGFLFEVDNNEVPYLFISDPLNSGKVAVKIFDGTAWVDLGGIPVSEITGTPLAMTVGSNNFPFVIYQEGSIIKASQFNGNSWVSIPSSDLEGLSSVVVKMDNNNVPHVLYNGYFKKFNGSGWDEVGITGFTSIGTSICFNSLNQPYIVVGNSIRKFNGITWETLPSLTSIYSNNSLTISIDAVDNLYATYTTLSLLDKKIVKLEGTTWQSIGAFSSYGSIALSIDDTTVYEQHTKNTNFPVVQKKTVSGWEMLGVESDMIASTTSSGSEYRKYTALAISNYLPIVTYKNTKLVVKESNINGVWSNVGGDSVSEEYISNAKIETDSQGNTYIAYLNVESGSSQSLLTVKKRVGNIWELVGPLNFSLTASIKMDFKINHQNELYVAYKSGRVQKFNGTSWEFVGGTAYAYDNDVQLAFNGNDQPYIIYDGATGPVVKTFNGLSWIEIGSESLSPYTYVTQPQIAIDASNNIIIAFVDTTQKIHVMTWNGTSWVQLGQEIITNTGYGKNFLSLAIDLNNVPHIMFNRLYNNFRKMANVYKFEGASWEPLGIPDFSSGDVTEGNIVFTNNNIPVVTYCSLNGIYIKYYGGEEALLSTNQYQSTTTSSVVISPNPVQYNFSINSNKKVESIAIFDLTGKKVFSSKETKDVNISSLMKGIYLIKIKTDMGVYSNKIFKK